jgi:hypothetical protein
LIHSSAAKARELGSIGGQRTCQRRRAALAQLPAPRNSEEVVNHLALCVTEMRSGALDARLGMALVGALSALLKALDMSSFEKRTLCHRSGTGTAKNRNAMES